MYIDVIFHLNCNIFSGVQKRALSEISSDIFFSNTRASALPSASASDVMSVADKKASQPNDGDSDCEDTHGN